MPLAQRECPQTPYPVTTSMRELQDCYEELEDDFLFLANDGQVAVVIDESAE